MRIGRWHRIGLIAGIVIIQLLALFPAKARPASTLFDVTFDYDDLRDFWTPSPADTCSSALWVTDHYLSTPSGCWDYPHFTPPHPAGLLRLYYTFPSNLNNIILSEIDVAAGPGCASVTIDAVRFPDPDPYYCVGTYLYPAVAVDDHTIYIDAQIEGSPTVSVYYVRLFYTADELPPTVNPGASTAGVDGTCKLCKYNPIGDWFRDLPDLFNFLACQIGNIFYCHVIPILLGIWRQIVEFMTLIQSSIYYAISQANSIASWINGNTMIVVRFADGTYQNGVTRIENALYGSIGGTTTTVVGGGGATLMDVVLEFIKQIGNLLNNLTNVLPTLITAFRDVMVAIIGAIVQIAFLLVQLVITLINIVIMIAGIALRALAIIPLLFGAFTDGFDGTMANPLAPAVGDGFLHADAPLSDATVLGQSCEVDPYFQLCLAIYVMDNTLYGGDSGDFTIPFLIFFIQALAGVGILVNVARRLNYAFTHARA